jgi:toxin YoeB
MKNIFFTKNAWEDYQYWQQNDHKILKRINDLIKECQRDAYSGIGKPEALKHSLAGYWSRRINSEHRMVYRLIDDSIQILQLRYHYS